LEEIKGVPWKWNPDEEEKAVGLKVRWLTEEERMSGAATREENIPRAYRMRMKKSDFLKHGFTEGCPGCTALIAGTEPRGHLEKCRERMEKAIVSTEEGRQRKERHTQHENELLARHMEHRFGEEDAERRTKKARVEEPERSQPSSSSSSQEPARTEEEMQEAGEGPRQKKRDQESDVEDFEEEQKRRKVDRQKKREQESDEEDVEEEQKRRKVENEDVEVSMVERLMQEDMKWGINGVSDMCEQDHEDIRRIETDMQYYDENTWEALDPEKVAQGEKAEIERFRKMMVYEYVSRERAQEDEEGKFVKVKWVRTNKGTSLEQEVRCRLVAQELGYGEKMDELFAGTPSLSAVKTVLYHASEGGQHRCAMILDVKCAFLYGSMRRRVYIELPRQDPRHGSGDTVGLLKKAMYGTRDAPQIWQEEVQRTMEEIGFKVSMLHPSIYHHPGREVVVVVHVDDFLCSGEAGNLEWLYQSLRKRYDLSRTMVGSEFEQECKYLNRIVRWTDRGFEIEGDPKHVNLLLKEWGMEQCSLVDTPITKEGQDQAGSGEELKEEEARNVRRSIARINYMAQDRPDLSVAARILSQNMSQPRAGVLSVIKRVIRYLRKYPRGILEIRGDMGMEHIHIWTDSDWAGDHVSRRSCSGGSLQLGDTTVQHWSKLQSNIALSSGEAELNAAVKGISEGIGLLELMQEVFRKQVNMTLHVDANACRGILLRHGAGKVKHLTTKQLWVQGAIKSYNIQVEKVPREQNSADVLTHPTNANDLETGLNLMNFRRE
jgi:hypothetical protein